MGNTVGSTNTNFCDFVNDPRATYMLGLWCADGYHRTSSIGLSNGDIRLIGRFEMFLRGLFPDARIKQRIYPIGGRRKQIAYHVYVNSRSLLREFRNGRKQIADLKTREIIGAYFAGRFDGDGSIAADFYRDCRIAYGNEKEAETDFALLQKVGFLQSRIYRYRKARTWVLYISRNEVKDFLALIQPMSVKLQKLVFVPRRDLTSQREV